MNVNYKPLDLDDANRFITMFHRHNRKVIGHKFSIGIFFENELIGVSIVGRPLARKLDNGNTVEILRLCVKEGYPNVASRLYNRTRKICELMGYDSVITYTLQTEPGSSLKAIGAKIVHETKGNKDGWLNRKGRKKQKVVSLDKYRWELLSEGKKGE